MEFDPVSFVFGGMLATATWLGCSWVDEQRKAGRKFPWTEAFRAGTKRVKERRWQLAALLMAPLAFFGAQGIVVRLLLG